MAIEIRSMDEIREKEIEYAKRVLEIEKEIAALKADLKAMALEYKEEGVNANKIKKAISRIKKEMKQDVLAATEEENTYEMLSKNGDITNAIQGIVSLEKGE